MAKKVKIKVTMKISVPKEEIKDLDCGCDLDHFLLGKIMTIINNSYNAEEAFRKLHMDYKVGEIKW